MDDRVALLRCADYDVELVRLAVRRAVDLVGGIGRFVKPGQRVLVKPNLLQAMDPDRAVVTHPVVVRAVIELAQEAGGHVVVADNPVVLPVTRRGWQNFYERVGLTAVAAETGAELNMEIVPQRRAHPEGDLVKLVDTSSFFTEADVMISVPKLKTHGLVRFTGAVKNLFGTVPGATKFGYHVKLQSPERFAEMLLDLASFVRPALTVMDAVLGMDGDGPSAGQPFPIGALVVGADPVAVDVVALELVGQDPVRVPTVAGAQRRGWTSGRAADLRLVGDDLAELRVSGFKMPVGGQSTMDHAPAFVQRWGARQLVASPFITDLCIGCGLCVQNCPVQTIDQIDTMARIELAGCIRCYCCHELCPEQAIELRQPWLRRMLVRLGQ